MEEKKANLLEQLERMKEGAEDLQKKGIKYYAMHAECAVKFATEAIEVLTATDPTKEELKPGFTLRRADGTSETVESDCFSILCVDDHESGTTYNMMHGTNGDLLGLIELHQRNTKRLLGIVKEELHNEIETFLGDRDESK